MDVIGGVRTDGWRDESDKVAAGELDPVAVERVGGAPSSS